MDRVYYYTDGDMSRGYGPFYINSLHTDALVCHVLENDASLHERGYITRILRWTSEKHCKRIDVTYDTLSPEHLD